MLLRRALPALLACVLLASPAWAAGTGGIVVTPLGDGEGAPPSSFRVEVPREGTTTVPFVVQNVEDGTRSARLYAAPVTRSGESFALGPVGTSPWVELPEQEVTLEAGEVRDASFEVRGGDLPDDEQLAAVVVEVTNGAVVQRASTLVYLEAAPRVPLPLLAVAAAVLLVVLAAVAWVVAGRRRTQQAAPPG